MDELKIILQFVRHKTGIQYHFITCWSAQICVYKPITIRYIFLSGNLIQVILLTRILIKQKKYIMVIL